MEKYILLPSKVIPDADLIKNKEESLHSVAQEKIEQHDIFVNKYATIEDAQEAIDLEKDAIMTHATTTDLALVRFKAVACNISNEDITSPEITKLSVKLNETIEKWNELATSFYFVSAKSKNIGCKTCGSSINIQVSKSNDCPVCKCDLRPESAKLKIEECEVKISELSEKITKLRGEYVEKLLDTGAIGKIIIVNLEFVTDVEDNYDAVV